MNKPLIYSLIIILIIALDRLAKVLITDKTKNYGAAFGILQNYTILFVIVAIILIVFIIYYMRKADSEILRVSLALILAGTIGNLIDRLIYGYVIDVINTNIIPSFNISDLANTIGAILLVVYMFRKK